jgi:meso-butanediol dehydrogenase/(S,S)-butanediol dehydrogenase/diacetyl reductase
MRGLRGRAIVVTGAASGIGQAVSERLAEEGARVALLDRDEMRLGALAATLGDAALPLAVDVADAQAMERAVVRAADRFGDLGGVVTSAGIFAAPDRQPLAAVPLETFQHTLQVNLVGTFLALKLVTPHLQRTRGAAVTIASTAGLRGHGFGSGYTASKGGVIALTRLLAFQYGGDGVRANCICPGPVDTPMSGGAYRQPEWAVRLKRTVPIGRAATAAEIASTVCFLLSDDAIYVSGQVIAIDGGASVM